MVERPPQTGAVTKTQQPPDIKTPSLGRLWNSECYPA